MKKCASNNSCTTTSESCCCTGGLANCISKTSSSCSCTGGVTKCISKTASSCSCTGGTSSSCSENKPQSCVVKKPICFKRFFHRYTSFFKRRIKSIIWGISEGLASGALSGCNLAGAGGWFFATLNQIFGSFFGALGGIIAGFLAGTVADQKTLMCVFESYRKNFGVGHGNALKR